MADLYIFPNCRSIPWQQHLSAYNNKLASITGRYSLERKRSVIWECTESWYARGGAIYDAQLKKLDKFEAVHTVKKLLANNKRRHGVQALQSASIEDCSCDIKTEEETVNIPTIQTEAIEQPKPKPPTKARTIKPRAIKPNTKPTKSYLLRIVVDGALIQPAIQLPTLPQKNMGRPKRKRISTKFFVDELEPSKTYKKKKQRLPNRQQPAFNPDLEKLYVHGIPKRKACRQFSPENKRMLSNLGLDRRFIDFAADVYFDWLGRFEEVQASPTRDWDAPPHSQHQDSTIESWLRIHQTIKSVVLSGTFRSLREGWVDIVDKRVNKGGRNADRTFIGLVCMILSPIESDKHLFQLIERLPYSCPKSLFQWAKSEGGWTDGSFRKLVSILGYTAHRCAMNVKKSNFIIFAAIIFLVAPREDVISPEGMFSLHGVSLKVLFETQQGLLDNVIGIGCDSHMITMFEHFGWISARTVGKDNKKISNHDLTAKEMMAWMPYREWECMNRCYAGMGQIFQSGMIPRNDLAKAIRLEGERRDLTEAEKNLIESMMRLKPYNGSMFTTYKRGG